MTDSRQRTANGQQCRWDHRHVVSTERSYSSIGHDGVHLVQLHARRWRRAQSRMPRGAPADWPPAATRPRRRCNAEPLEILGFISWMAEIPSAAVIVFVRADGCCWRCRGFKWPRQSIFCLSAIVFSRPMLLSSRTLCCTEQDDGHQDNSGTSHGATAEIHLLTPALLRWPWLARRQAHWRFGQLQRPADWRDLRRRRPN